MRSRQGCAETEHFDYEVSRTEHLESNVLPSVVSIDDGENQNLHHPPLLCLPSIYLKEPLDDSRGTEPLSKLMQERKAKMLT